MGDSQTIWTKVDSDAFTTTSTHTRASVVGTDGTTSADTDAHVQSILANVDVDSKANSATCTRAASTGGADATTNAATKSNVCVRLIM
jgi:hypothetical protein